MLLSPTEAGGHVAAGRGALLAGIAVGRRCCRRRTAGGVTELLGQASLVAAAQGWQPLGWCGLNIQLAAGPHPSPRRSQSRLSPGRLGAGQGPRHSFGPWGCSRKVRQEGNRISVVALLSAAGGESPVTSWWPFSKYGLRVGLQFWLYALHSRFYFSTHVAVIKSSHAADVFA
jgi:hypothetical protein